MHRFVPEAGFEPQNLAYDPTVFSIRVTFFKTHNHHRRREGAIAAKEIICNSYNLDLLKA